MGILTFTFLFIFALIIFIVVRDRTEITSNKEVVSSLILNLLGFQSFRYILGKTLYWLKLKTNKNYNLEENISSEVIKLGYAKKNNFLSKEEFLKIKQEYCQAIDEIKNKIKKGSNDDRRIKIDENTKEKYPSLYKLKDSAVIKNIFTDCELKNNIQINCVIERIEVFDNTIYDLNRDFHYDTFYNTFKAWLFLDDVTEKKGPFHIIPESHKFSIKRLFSEYWFSILYSLKIFNKDSKTDLKKKIKLNKKSIKAEVSKNTLIVANTHGLHRRGDAENGSIRESIHFWTREHPFKIFLK
jgi:hypothetical protein